MLPWLRKPSTKSQKMTTKRKQGPPCPDIKHTTSYLIQLYRPACRDSKHDIHWCIWRQMNSSLQHDPPFWQPPTYSRKIFHLTSIVLVLNVRTMHWSKVTSHISRLNLNADIYISAGVIFALIEDTVAFINHSLRPPPPWPWQAPTPRNVVDSVFEQAKSGIFKPSKNVRDVFLLQLQLQSVGLSSNGPSTLI